MQHVSTSWPLIRLTPVWSRFDSRQASWATADLQSQRHADDGRHGSEQLHDQHDQGRLKKKGEDREPTFSEIVEAKIVLANALTKTASAVLVDGYYGVWNSVASFAIPPNVGILVRVEKSGGTKNTVGAPLMDIEPGWGVGKSSAAVPTPSSSSLRSSRPSRPARSINSS